MGSPWVKNHRSELRIVHQGFQEMTHCDIHDQSLDGAQFRKFKRLMKKRIRKQKIPWDYSNHCYFNIFNFKPKTKNLPTYFYVKLPSSTSSKISQAEKTCFSNDMDHMGMIQPWPPDDLVCHAHPHDSRSSPPPGGRPGHNCNYRAPWVRWEAAFFTVFWGVHNIKLRQVFKDQTCLKNIKIFKCV